LTACKDFVYFTANDSIHGTELWKTDGTIEGTQMVLDLAEGQSSTRFNYLKVFKDTLFLIVYREGQNQLCKLIGNEVVEISSIANNINSFVTCGNYLYFLALNQSAYTLWVSDGTAGGTVALNEFEICNQFTAVNGKLFFSASEIDQGNEELWSTDGTQLGTDMVKDIGAGYSSEPTQLINFNNKLFFTAYTNESGREIWQSDGTEENTFQIADINPGSQSALNKANFYNWGNILFFSANSGTNGFELWKTDGGESGTVLVKDIKSGSESSFPLPMASNENAIYFQAYDTEHGTELWKSNGDDTGTELMADILTGMQSSTPTNILLNSTEVFFIAETADNGRQIWKMDLDPAQTSIDKNLDMPFSVYPNPCKEILHVNTDGNIGNFTIYNIQGQIVATKDVVNNSIDITELNNGIYIIGFYLNGQMMVRKFIKQ
jgi:ELWxxDGT repeat protein